MKTILARDANRHFSSVLREVTAGEVITVLSRGKPVATIAPAQTSDLQRNAARRRLLVGLQEQVDFHPRDWSRTELYEE